MFYCSISRDHNGKRMDYLGSITHEILNQYKTYEMAIKDTVNDILVRKKKDRLVAVLLYLVGFSWGAIIFLEAKVSRLENEKSVLISTYQQQRINDLKNENDYLLKLKNQVDSANTKLQIFNIEKQMK